MSVGPVAFYSMRGSLSSGEYPLLTGSESAVHTVTAKYEIGLQTYVDVPIFIGYDIVNVARIENSYYWVTEFKERTNANSQIRFVLDYMAPTSLLRRNDTINGIWQRTPTIRCPYLQDQITNDVMGSSRTIDFSDMDCPESKSFIKTYWIQVSGHDNQGNMRRFGGFIGYDEEQHDFDWLNAPSSYRAGVDPPNDYIPFGKWMTNLYDITGFVADDIDDISVSKRCPYRVYSAQYNPYIYRLAITYNGQPIPPLSVTIDQVTYDYFDLTREFNAGRNIDTNTTSKTVELTTKERLTGHIGIRDWNRNEIMVINTSRSDTITVTAEMHTDTSGIYTIIRAYDNQISIPEGKLPYFGNSADRYKAYSMDSDRLAMQYAIQNAHYNRETADITAVGNAVSGSLQGLAMGALTGNPITAASGVMSGVASGVTSIYENQRALDLSIMQANQDNTLSRKRAIDQPTSGYNVGYGSIYAYLNEASPLCIDIKQPVNISNTYYTRWAENFGYPAEGQITLTIVTGYYQGKILNDGTRIGMLFDELSKTFANGFKFVNP